MPEQRRLADDLFVLPKDNDRFYLYAPLRRSLAVINGAAVNAVARHLTAEGAALNPAEAAIIADLEDKGLIGGEIPAPPIFPKDYEFRPHEVTLFLTSRCNLRCRYCYADAGCKAADMAWETARAAIDLVAENAGILGSSRFAVGFHGGGEPTMNWDLLVRSVDYTRDKARKLGLEAEVFAATNALLRPEQREYIVSNFSTVNVSLDGPPDIQDANRPQANGRGSFEGVSETLHFFDAKQFPYGIRATITASTVGRMEEVVSFLGREFHFRYLHLEPVWQCGRCLTSGEKPPRDDEFIDNFLKVSGQPNRHGVEVTYSGARLGVLTSKFCAAPGDGFTVLPEGGVTSCYEITEASDPRASIFHFGQFNPRSGRYDFAENRIKTLQKLSVENLPFCQDCFCKWHCAGDCLAKVFEKSGSFVHEGSIRCRLNRALTLAGLDRLVEGERREPHAEQAG